MLQKNQLFTDKDEEHWHYPARLTLKINQKDMNLFSRQARECFLPLSLLLLQNLTVFNLHISVTWATKLQKKNRKNLVVSNTFSTKVSFLFKVVTAKLHFNIHPFWMSFSTSVQPDKKISITNNKLQITFSIDNWLTIFH